MSEDLRDKDTSRKIERLNSRQVTTRKKLLLISTGGTIASRVDYRTGAVYPALSASVSLLSSSKELNEIAVIEPEVVFSTYSENLTRADWQVPSQRVLELAKSKTPDGIVIMMGTDTLAYSSAALSFSLLGFSLPIVFVGAQRSPDRPSSDAALNLTAATYFAVNSKPVYTLQCTRVRMTITLPFIQGYA